MPRKNKVLKIGDPAPSFELTSAVERRVIRLDSYRGENHVVLAFFRGTW